MMKVFQRTIRKYSQPRWFLFSFLQHWQLDKEPWVRREKHPRVTLHSVDDDRSRMQRARRFIAPLWSNTRNKIYRYYTTGGFSTHRLKKKNMLTTLFLFFQHSSPLDTQEKINYLLCTRGCCFLTNSSHKNLQYFKKKRRESRGEAFDGLCGLIFIISAIVPLENNHDLVYLFS